MLNFNNFEYSKLTLPQNEDEKKVILENLKNKFINEVKESEDCRNYFSKYDPTSIDKFINEYAERKASLIGSLDYLLRKYNEDDNEEYLQNAREVLRHILQKKLFNLQLQWRAGSINIDGVQTTFDFEFWSQNIEYCPFISPITVDELELMKKYLKKNYFCSLDKYGEGQSYNELMQKDEDGTFENMSDWYEYYDQIFGTGKLLLLPDKRGEREMHYMRIAHEKDRKEYEEKIKNNPPPPYLPPIFTFFKEILDFVIQCEKDPYFRTLFKIWFEDIYPEYKDAEYDKDNVQSAIEVLEKADRPIALSSNEIWHKAIIDAAEKYITDRTLEVLDIVYEEYITLENLAIAPRYTPEEEQEARNQGYWNHLSEFILKGRELCGEPRNFDYLDEL